MGKELFYRMLWMMFSSCWYSLFCKPYEFSLLYRNLIAAYFVLIGMVGSIRDYGVSERRLPVYGRFPIGGSFMDGKV